MGDTSLSDFFLTAMITYGAPAFGLALFLGALGVPVPGTLFVVAAGAFARQGFLDWKLASLLGLLSVVLGDSIIYALGHYAREWVEHRFGQIARWQEAQAVFRRRGGLAIYLTRFALTPLAIPVDLISGGSDYPFWRFLSFDLAGEVTWVALYGGLGYLFGSQWELISQFLIDFGGLLLGGVILAAGIYLLLRRRWRQPVQR